MRAAAGQAETAKTHGRRQPSCQFLQYVLWKMPALLACILKAQCGRQNKFSSAPQAVQRIGTASPMIAQRWHAIITTRVRLGSSNQVNHY
jgi:hypothetical protein